MSIRQKGFIDIFMKHSSQMNDSNTDIAVENINSSSYSEVVGKV